MANKVNLQMVPHKAVGKFQIGNIWERLVSVNDGRQSEPANGLKSGWRQRSAVVVVVVIVVAM